MNSGESVGDASALDHALDAYRTGLDHLIKVVGDGGLEELDDPGLVQVWQTFEQLRNRLPLVDHALIADAKRRDLPGALCQGTVRRLLTSMLSIAKGEAAQRVRAAEAVGPRVSMLGAALSPARSVLSAAQEAGEVSADKVGIIVAALGKVDGRGFEPAAIDAGERLLTEQARLLGPEDLRMVAERVVDAIAPDGTLPKDRLNSDRRFFHLRPTKDGAYVGEFRLTGAAGAKLTALLDPLAAPRPAGPEGPLDTRTRGQRMHDAVEDVCDRLLRSDSLPESGGTPATVIVTLDYDDLLARAGYGHAADGTLIPTSRVRELADQAEIVPVVLRRGGAVLDLGRTRRIASRSQTLALYARDGGCSFPGCAHPPQWCERHHIIGWVDGGLTDLDNLTLLCAYHHHNFAARGWVCALNADRIPEWTPPRWVDRDQRPLVHARVHAALLARTLKRTPAPARC